MTSTLSHGSRNGAAPPSSVQGDNGVESKPSNRPRTTGSQLPAWLDHFNWKDLKILIRCSVALWVMALFIFIEPTLHALGTATFFGCIVLLIIPPAGVVFVTFLTSLTLIFGMALAWAWGVITMKAAQAARPAAETQTQLQALQQQAAAMANGTDLSVKSTAQILVLNGFLLDARVTTVYFVMIGLFVYFMARLRVRVPKLTLTQIFSTIIIDVTLTTGPALPSFSGLLPVVLIKPAAVAVGIGLVSSIIFFPQSTSHVVLTAMEKVISPMKGPLASTASSLAEDEPTLDLAQLRKTKSQIIAAYKAMEPSMAFLPLDFSIGRWNAGDVKSLKEPLRMALLAVMSLLDFQIACVGSEIKMEKYLAVGKEEPDEKGAGERKHKIGMRQLAQSSDLAQALEHPDIKAMKNETKSILNKSSVGILKACDDAINTTVECIHTVNSRRWFARPSREDIQKQLQHQEAVLETLRTERETFTTKTTDGILETHADLFDEDGKLKPVDDGMVNPLRAVVVGMIFEDRVLGVANTLEKLLSRAHALAKERSQVRIWFPTGIRYAAAWVFGRTIIAPVAGTTPDIDPDAAEERSKDAQRRLQISRGYRVKRRSGLGRVILATYHWFGNSEGLFALRMLIVTVALAIPAVCSSSAGFYYREKGLWALIMAQTTLMPYMADFTFSLASRLVGTIIGGVMGLVAWYIGSGTGDGNPYGLAAILAVMVVILVWARLFISPVFLQAIVMSGATCFLVVGYSFDDTHIVQYGAPGVGYNVFWRRTVLSLIGFAGSLIVQIFPRPPSASRHVSKTLSIAYRTISDHYALMLSSWGTGDADIGPVVEKITLDLAERLAGLNGPIALLRFEFSGSPFDSASLSRVQLLCEDMNQNLGRLMFLSVSLPMELQDRLTQFTGVLDHRIIGEVMSVLGVVEQAMKTSDAPPEVLPTPLVNRCVEYRRSQNMDVILTTALMRDEHYRKYCVALSSYFRFLSAIDELVLVVKGELGESHVVAKELLSEV